MSRTLDGEAPPLFVVGCGRSGTTMLRLMLDSHPDLAIPWESHFITALWADRHRYRRSGGLDAGRLVEDVVRSPMFHQWDTPAEAVRQRVDRLQNPTFATVIEAAFSACAEQRGKTRWGDKTPIYVRSIPLLHRLFPSARFIHVIRDGRDVALSYLSLPWGPDTIWRAAYKWRRDVSAGRRGGGPLGDSRYTEIRYEHLVRDPRAVLKRLCAFADLSFDERMLQHDRDGAQRLASPERHEQYHAAAATVPKSGMRNWRDEMAGEDVAAFESMAGSLLTELGYERRHPDVGIRLRSEAAIRAAAIYLVAAGSRAKKRLIRTAGSRRQVPR